MRRRLPTLDPFLLTILALCLPIITPFLTGRLPLTADAMMHLHRMVSAAYSLENGVYPRWSPYLHAGFGYPLHIFYTPLWHIGGGALYALFETANPVHLWLGVQALAVFITATGGYAFARQVGGDSWGAFLAALAFTYAPLRLREIWTQGNLSQLLGMGLIAWCFWGAAGLVRIPSPRRVALFALPLGALILTHHPTAFYTLPALGFYLCTAAWGAAESWRDAARRFAFGLAGYASGLALGLVYAAPALTETRYTWLDSSISTAFNIRQHFLALGDLFREPPLIDRAEYQPTYPLTFGLIGGLLALGGFGLGVGRWQALSRWKKTHLIGAGAGLALCLFLMTRPALPLWEAVPLAERLSFPWRLLGLAYALALPLWALLLSATPAAGRGKLAMMGAALLLASNLSLIYPQGETHPPFAGRVTPADAQAYERAVGVLGMTGENEYLPRVTAAYTSRPATVPDPALYQGFDWFFELWDVPPDLQARPQDSPYGTGMRWQVTSPRPTPLVIRQMAYPGWRAELDGQALTLYPSGEFGLLTLDLPAGTHTLDVWYAGTPAQRYSLLVSALALALCAVLLLEGGRPHPAQNAPLATTRTGWRLFALTIVCVALNQVYLLPHTSFMRPASPLTAPYAMETAQTQQFFEPDIGYRLELLGYTLEKRQAKAGETLEITLFWRALAPFGTSTDVKLWLTPRDQSANYGQVVTAGIAGTNPNFWPLDRYVRQPLRLSLAPDAPPYPLQIRLQVADGVRGRIWLNQAQSPETVLTEIRVQGRGDPRLPPDAQNVDSAFGGLRLRAYQWEAGGTILRLFWYVSAPVSLDYTLFIHGIHSGQIVSQADQPPLGLNYRTSEWRQGQFLESRLRVGFPPSLDGVRLGFYDPLSGARLGGDGVLLAAP